MSKYVLTVLQEFWRQNTSPSSKLNLSCCKRFSSIGPEKGSFSFTTNNSHQTQKEKQLSSLKKKRNILFFYTLWSRLLSPVIELFTPGIKKVHHLENLSDFRTLSQFPPKSEDAVPKEQSVQCRCLEEPKPLRINVKRTLEINSSDIKDPQQIGTSDVRSKIFWGNEVKYVTHSKPSKTILLPRKTKKSLLYNITVQKYVNKKLEKIMPNIHDEDQLSNLCDLRGHNVNKDIAHVKENAHTVLNTSKDFLINDARELKQKVIENGKQELKEPIPNCKVTNPNTSKQINVKKAQQINKNKIPELKITSLKSPAKDYSNVKSSAAKAPRNLKVDNVKKLDNINNRLVNTLRDTKSNLAGNNQGSNKRLVIKSNNKYKTDSQINRNSTKPETKRPLKTSQENILKNDYNGLTALKEEVIERVAEVNSDKKGVVLESSNQSNEELISEKSEVTQILVGDESNISNNVEIENEDPECNFINSPQKEVERKEEYIEVTTTENDSCLNHKSDGNRIRTQAIKLDNYGAPVTMSSTEDTDGTRSEIEIVNGSKLRYTGVEKHTNNVSRSKGNKMKPSKSVPNLNKTKFQMENDSLENKDCKSKQKNRALSSNNNNVDLTEKNSEIQPKNSNTAKDEEINEIYWEHQESESKYTTSFGNLKERSNKMFDDRNSNAQNSFKDEIDLDREGDNRPNKDNKRYSNISTRLKEDEVKSKRLTIKKIKNEAILVKKPIEKHLPQNRELNERNSSTKDFSSGNEHIADENSIPDEIFTTELVSFKAEGEGVFTKKEEHLGNSMKGKLVDLNTVMEKENRLDTKEENKDPIIKNIDKQKNLKSTLNTARKTLIDVSNFDKVGRKSWKRSKVEPINKASLLKDNNDENGSTFVKDHYRTPNINKLNSKPIDGKRMEYKMKPSNSVPNLNKIKLQMENDSLQNKDYRGKQKDIKNENFGSALPSNNNNVDVIENTSEIQPHNVNTNKDKEINKIYTHHQESESKYTSSVELKEKPTKQLNEKESNSQNSFKDQIVPARESYNGQNTKNNRFSNISTRFQKDEIKNDKLTVRKINEAIVVKKPFTEEKYLLQKREVNERQSSTKKGRGENTGRQFKDSTINPTGFSKNLLTLNKITNVEAANYDAHKNEITVKQENIISKKNYHEEEKIRKSQVNQNKAIKKLTPEQNIINIAKPEESSRNEINLRRLNETKKKPTRYNNKTLSDSGNLKNNIKQGKQIKKLLQNKSVKKSSSIENESVNKHSKSTVLKNKNENLRRPNKLPGIEGNKIPATSKERHNKQEQNLIEKTPLKSKLFRSDDKLIQKQIPNEKVVENQASVRVRKSAEISPFTRKIVKNNSHNYEISSKSMKKW